MTREFQISKQLYVMHLKQCFDGFQFNYYFVFDQQVDAKSIFQFQPIVHNR